jgi:hypothetical protein
MIKFVPTSKEKWVIDRLKREGWKTFGDYSDTECLLWKPLKSWGGWNVTGCIEFFISRDMGCYLKFRPSEKPQLHFTWHFRWPSKKNWAEIAEAEMVCRNANQILSNPGS